MIIYPLNQTKDRLWTFSFINLSIGNFLLFFAFYTLVPIFPLFLIETLGTTKSEIGLILSSYTLAALLIRPFAGFVLDMVYRKPVYILAYLLFVISFVGYPLANSIGLFLFFRILHGFTFGFVTTAGNSLVVDIMPASRRGEGLGYFGLANTLAMAIGPMIGLLMHDSYSFNTIFYMAIGSGLLGFLFVSTVKSKNMADKNKQQPVAFDRFFLLKGLNAGFCLMLLGIPYGIAVTYIALYGNEIGIRSGVGVFFTLMAIGLGMSRLFSGKMVDRGKLVPVIAYGTLMGAVGFFALAALKFIQSENWVLILFYIISLLIGISYGLIFPAYNTLFVNLAPNNRRATASSTYMTSWDIGIGIGLVAGGWIGDSRGGLMMAYAVGAVMILVSLIYFVKIAGPHFDRNKLR